MLNFLILSSSIILSSFIISHSIQKYTYNIEKKQMLSNYKLLKSKLENLFFICNIDNENNEIKLYSLDGKRIYPHINTDNSSIFFTEVPNSETIVYFYLSMYKNKQIIIVEYNFLQSLTEKKEINYLHLYNGVYYINNDITNATWFTYEN